MPMRVAGGEHRLAPAAATADPSAKRRPHRRIHFFTPDVIVAACSARHDRDDSR